MIRLMEHTDVDEIYNLVDENRDYLKKWLPWLDHNKTKDDTKNFITTSLREYADQKSMVNVVLDQGQICGICGFNSFNWTIKAGYTGYWLAEKFQGRGLISKACLQLEKIGFDKMGLNKIEIHVAENNDSSRAVAERLQYQETGKLLDAEWLYDHYVDHIVYYKLRGEFLKHER